MKRIALATMILAIELAPAMAAERPVQLAAGRRAATRWQPYQYGPAPWQPNAWQAAPPIVSPDGSGYTRPDSSIEMKPGPFGGFPTSNPNRIPAGSNGRTWYQFYGGDGYWN
jgi:hypothetical protein